MSYDSGKLEKHQCRFVGLQPESLDSGGPPAYAAHWLSSTPGRACDDTSQREAGPPENCDIHFLCRPRNKRHAPMSMAGLWPSAALRVAHCRHSQCLTPAGFTCMGLSFLVRVFRAHSSPHCPISPLDFFFFFFVPSYIVPH